MNAKQRRTAQREYAEKVAPKLIELRLLGAVDYVIDSFRRFSSSNTLESVQSEINLYRRK